MTLLEKLGGRPTLERVHKILYDRLFAHPQLSKFFVNTPREHQEVQQTDFMSWKMGGPSNFFGKEPKPAHRHLFITEPIFEARHQMLKDALIACEVPDELRNAWLAIDYAFKHQVVKKSISECVPRYADEGILAVEFP